MVKALPTSKLPVDHIYCQECGHWFKQSECQQGTLYAVHSDNHAFTSDYDGCDYYTEYTTKYVWQCPNGDWIWDENDGDVDTPSTSIGIFYECQTCNNVFPDKDDADNCCS